jgi:hypothetical protein
MNNKSKIKFFNGKSADAELSRKLLNAASHAALDIKKSSSEVHKSNIAASKYNTISTT